MAADFNKIADYYDYMYVEPEEYRKETDAVDAIIQNYGRTNGCSLLDIACGTGEQASLLSGKYRVTGMDLSESMIEIARKKARKAEFITGDMFDFHLNQKFDAIVNLYGSIGFAKDTEQLEKGLKCAYEHLKTNGVFILTPWDTEDTFQEGLVAESKNADDFCYCRMESVKRISKNRIQVDMHHLIGKQLEIEQFHHTQMITLFSEKEYISCIKSAGLRLLRRFTPNEFRMGAFVCTR